MMINGYDVKTQPWAFNHLFSLKQQPDTALLTGIASTFGQ